MLKKMLGIVVLVAICLTGCGNLVQEENSTEEPLVSYDFGEYSKIGISFSEILRKPRKTAVFRDALKLKFNCIFT